MLKRLRIRELAVFEDVSLELVPGLNVITGETGAGKSLVLTALSVLLAARTPSGAVRKGSSEAQIEADFSLEPELVPLLDQAGIEHPPGAEVRIARTVRPSGRGNCTVAGRPITVARLAEVGRSLAHFAFQHAQVEVGSPRQFIEALDKLSGQTAMVADYARAYAELTLLRSELTELDAELNRRKVRQSRVRAQLEELERLSPEPGEHGSLRARLDVLRRSRQYLELAFTVKSVIGEREHSLEDEVSELLRAVSRLGAQSASIRPLADALHRARGELEECVRAAERLELELELEPGELDALESRCFELERVAGALGIATDALSEQAEVLRAELASVSELEDRLSLLVQREQRALQQASELAESLHRRREKVAPELQRRIERELAELCLVGARLSLELGLRSPADLDSAGRSELQVRFAANPGEAMGSLADVASGGERARLLLALRAIGLESAGTTLVFDELDAGVGGAAAEAVAQRLSRLARARQVICVTHQASIAASADALFRVHKATERGRTCASVRRVTSKERVDELARMLAGRSSADRARALAHDLVKRAASRTKRSAA